MKKSFKAILALCLAVLLAASFSLSAAAVTEFSDGTYTFSKTENGTAVITDCNLTENEIEVPGTVLGYPVTGIGDYAFMSNSYISSVMLPSTVVSIGKYAFAENKALAYVTIPEGCAEIADNAFFNSPGVTIRCWYGSAADVYAGENQIPCEYLDNMILGDANGNGFVNISDVTAIQRHLAELEPLNSDRIKYADVNGGGLDISDATAIQMYLAEYENTYKIGEPVIIQKDGENG